ncbi:DNA-binding protein [Halomicroarcula sp. GCM10025709]|uniref:DNA-binding protein n=1 Tax=Haloarcula TaxID=2237 RepID=UPI003614465A
MSGKNVHSGKFSEEQGAKTVDLDVQADVVETEFEADVVTDTFEGRPSVRQEIQAKVDTNHPDAQTTGLTLEAEERLAAREAEIRRTHQRYDRGQESDREARTRRVAQRGSAERRDAFAKRAGSVNPWADPDREDPRAQLERAQLGEVNREAARVAGELPGWSRAAISRLVAQRVVEGVDMMEAVLTIFEVLSKAPGQVIPIGVVGEVDRSAVDIEGEVVTLWEPSHSAIAQVGLLEDETGTVKFTVWRKSSQPKVREGECVRIRSVAKSWYQGQVSVALTGRSQLTVLEDSDE